MATVRVFNHHVHSSYSWLALVDVILITLSFYAGAYVYFFFEPGSFQSYIPQIPSRALLFGVVTVLCLFTMGLYEPRMREGATGVLLRTAGGFIASTMIMAMTFYLLPELHMWRGIFVYSALFAFTGSLLSRITFHNLTDLDQFKSRVLVYGAGQAASTITSAMRRKTDRQGFNIVGFVRIGDEQPRIEGERVINLRQSLPDYVRQTEIDKIVVALDNGTMELPSEEFLKCRLAGVKVVSLVNFFEQEAGKILVDFASPEWMSFAGNFNASRTSEITKRWFDILSSFALLTFAWPIILLTAIAIRLESGPGAPIFFRQERVGLHGKCFQVLKFRSMTVDAERDGKAVWATKDDARVTRVGHFIRKTRIDELPQILNVLAGDMAFIGPRPERPEFVAELSREIPYFDARHCVKPGITGWAQLCYPYGASVDDAKQKLQFDLYYVKNHSLFLD
ncbi:MAG: TIGR03013 family XrtA/PEP-CTERM system glycosyltransferase, partial [Halioglobus sp.]